jgi:aspartate kinase
VVKISAFRVGMRSHSDVAARAFKALAENGINVRALTTSEIKFSLRAARSFKLADAIFS